MKKTIFLIIGISILLLADFSFAQSPPEDFSSYISADKLPPYYMGNDIKAAYKYLDEIVPPKDEFETIAEYNKKIDSIKINNIYAFYFNDYSEYNADLKLLVSHVRVDVKEYRGIHSIPKRYSIIIKSEDIGQNKDGSYSSYESEPKLVGTQYNIVIKNRNAFEGKLSYSDFNIPIKIKMEPQIAKELKSSLKLLLICKPILVQLPKNSTRALEEGYIDVISKKQFYAYSGITVNPSYKSLPKEYRKDFFININLLEIWVYNYQTGEIIKKVKAKSQSKNVK